MQEMTHDQVRQSVRSRYKEFSLQSEQAQSSCCAPGASCGTPAEAISARLGYSEEQLSSVPSGANLGLGCGNPQAIASLKAGEVVLDLGSGGGFDCFLAAQQVGPEGRVIGVDMTPEMISRARGNARRGGYSNTEFRLGEIEHLPVADTSVDVIISNCVINLSPDKPQLFRDAFRVLKRGGRLAISDVVLTAELPKEIMDDLTNYAGCISGAAAIDELEEMLRESGFHQISIQPKDVSKAFIKDWVPGSNVENYIVSATIQAVKP